MQVLHFTLPIPNSNAKTYASVNKQKGQVGKGEALLVGEGEGGLIEGAPILRHRCRAELCVDGRSDLASSFMTTRASKASLIGSHLTTEFQRNSCI